MWLWLIKFPEGTPNESGFTPKSVWMYPVLTSLVAELKWTFLGSLLIPRITWAFSGSRNSSATKCWWDPLLTVLMCMTQHYHTNLYPVERWKHLFFWPLCENLFVSLCVFECHYKVSRRTFAGWFVSEETVSQASLEQDMERQCSH